MMMNDDCVGFENNCIKLIGLTTKLKLYKNDILYDGSLHINDVVLKFIKLFITINNKIH